ncbi:DUF1507 family protein [Anaerobacillus sp. MEB173]|uniref:DUF1507 family protein n=1 Tax=Anaerobacillus sp. MEB173 TaxID=3383345 RepID=UPI003F91B0F3
MKSGSVISLENTLKLKTLELLKKDAEEIGTMIQVQKDNLLLPKCPLYQEVLDTQTYGLSCSINFATRLGLIEKESGKNILIQLEEKLLENIKI